MNDPKMKRVVDAGADLGIVVRPHTFSAGTRTSADAAREVGCALGQICKTLVFESDGGPVLFMVSGSNRVDLDKAAKLAGVPELRKADANSAKAATGFSIGATPPFGHDHPVPVFMDEDLLAFDEVWAAAGRPDSVFPVEPRALQRASGAVVGDLAERDG